jgi:23S rRNA pseudouridine1911/1915/1917 synthase
VADEVYGGVAQAGLLRQALHAHRLAFIHPLTGDPMQFEAPLAPDMQFALNGLSLHYN